MKSNRFWRGVIPAMACCAALATTAVPQDAEAFCGFYVSGATESLYNNATQVVLMREGTRTVLSMQNNYEGPPGDFAMVVPVPVVLQKENVKTLGPEVFAKVDQMAAPRLVEYWETDPCWQPRYDEFDDDGVVEKSTEEEPSSPPADEGGVVVEAQFKVGEYEIVILSASDSSGLDKWLRKHKYNIPKGAEPALRPYVEAGTKFFVAKVDAKKVKFDGNRAVLSPLRFHYDSKDFNLPIRLGLLNAKGHQDVIVHILARGQRYQVANYENVTVPTNLIVDNQVRKRFGEFYAALFDETLAQNPKAVVTEYAWDASTCDPCPGPTLNGSDFQLLGADVMPNQARGGFVLTRLHARYTGATLGEDLVFEAAPPIVGGRGTPDKYGELQEKGSTSGGRNNFQGRYAILHPWKGDIKCQNPIRGRWGGPPAGSAGKQTQAAMDLANAKRGAVKLPKLVRQDVPEIKLETANLMPKIGAKATPVEGKPMDESPVTVPEEESPSSFGCAVGPVPVARGEGSFGGAAVVVALAGLWLLRRKI